MPTVHSGKPYQPINHVADWIVSIDGNGALNDRVMGTRESRDYVVQQATAAEAVSTAIEAWQEACCDRPDEDKEIFGWAIYEIRLKQALVVEVVRAT